MKEEGKLRADDFLKKFSGKTDIARIKRLNITSSQVSDALNNIGGGSGVIEGVMPLFDTRVMGSVVTVKTASNDWGTCVKAIDKAKKGEILFINVDGDDKAIWGELTSRTAKEKGIIATMIHGAVRDVAAIEEMEYPVFTRNIVPNAGHPLAEGEINVRVECGSITVNPHDLVVGDECGVVVVPQELLEDVLNEAIKIKKKEKKIVSDIKKGNSLSSILGLK